MVWAIWDRLPLVTADIEESIYAVIAKKCRELGCRPIAIGGTADHLHVLVQLSPVVSIANLVLEIKGVSSHVVSHVLSHTDFFKWQGAYSAFTCAKEALPAIERYIRSQKEHHAMGSLRQEWENVGIVDGT